MSKIKEEIISTIIRPYRQIYSTKLLGIYYINILGPQNFVHNSKRCIRT